MINGNTQLIAHIGYPTQTFKSTMIYNPYFEEAGINTVVVPMGCKPEDFTVFLKSVFSLTNICGALITMPHKVAVVSLLDEVTPTVRVAGACNAVKKLADGRLAGAGIAAISLFDVNTTGCDALAQRLKDNYPAIVVQTGSNDPAGYDLVVNATPMGMNEGDPLPMDVSRLSPDTFVGEVVMRHETTAFLAAAQARGCRTQVGSDMLFEQIPAYLEYFDLPTTTAQELRRVARLSY
jgi:shikimate dehydrogenase